MNEDYMCKYCCAGRVRPLQFNLNEAIYICTNPLCDNYLENRPSECIIERPLIESSLFWKYESDLLSNDSKSTFGYSGSLSSSASRSSSADREVELLLKPSYASNFICDERSPSFYQFHEPFRENDKEMTQCKFMLDDRHNEMPISFNANQRQNEDVVECNKVPSTDDHTALDDVIASCFDGFCSPPSDEITRTSVNITESHNNAIIPSAKSAFTEISPLKIVQNSDKFLSPERKKLTKGISNLSCKDSSESNFLSPSDSAISEDSGFNEELIKSKISSKLFLSPPPKIRNNDHSGISNQSLSVASSSKTSKFSLSQLFTFLELNLEENYEASSYNVENISQLVDSNESPELVNNEDSAKINKQNELDEILKEALNGLNSNSSSCDLENDPFIKEIFQQTSKESTINTPVTKLNVDQLDAALKALTSIETTNNTKELTDKIKDTNSQQQQISEGGVKICDNYSPKNTPLSDSQPVNNLHNISNIQISSNLMKKEVYQKDLIVPNEENPVEVGSSNEDISNTVDDDLLSNTSENQDATTSQDPFNIVYSPLKNLEYFNALCAKSPTKSTINSENDFKRCVKAKRNVHFEDKAYVDPWSVPEIYLDELNIEVILQNQSSGRDRITTKEEKSESLSKNHAALSDNLHDQHANDCFNLNKNLNSDKLESDRQILPKGSSNNRQILGNNFSQEKICKETNHLIPECEHDSNCHNNLSTPIIAKTEQKVNIFKPVTLRPEILSLEDIPSNLPISNPKRESFRLSVGYASNLKHLPSQTTKFISKSDCENKISGYFDSILSSVEFDESFLRDKRDDRESCIDNFVMNEFLGENLSSEKSLLTNKHNEDGTFRSDLTTESLKVNNSSSKHHSKAMKKSDINKELINYKVMLRKKLKKNLHLITSKKCFMSQKINNEIYLKNLDGCFGNLKRSPVPYSYDLNEESSLSNSHIENESNPENISRYDNFDCQSPINTLKEQNESALNNQLSDLPLELNNLSSVSKSYSGKNKRKFSEIEPLPIAKKLKAITKYISSQDKPLISIAQSNILSSYMKNGTNHNTYCKKNGSTDISLKFEKNQLTHKSTIEKTNEVTLGSSKIKVFRLDPKTSSVESMNKFNALSPNPTKQEVIKFIKDTGWTVAPCSPSINYQAPSHALSPTVVPPALQNKYGNSKVTIWNMTNEAIINHDNVDKRTTSLGKIEDKQISPSPIKDVIKKSNKIQKKNNKPYILKLDLKTNSVIKKSKPVDIRKSNALKASFKAQILNEKLPFYQIPKRNSQMAYLTTTNGESEDDSENSEDDSENSKDEFENDEEKNANNKEVSKKNNCSCVEKAGKYIDSQPDPSQIKAEKALADLIKTSDQPPAFFCVSQGGKTYVYQRKES